VASLGRILLEIGNAIKEAELFVVVIRATSFEEAHAQPDTTHAERAHLHDTPEDLQQSLEVRNRMAYTIQVPPDEFADHFVVRNLYNPFIGHDEEG
jgi:hypothetical protein